MKDERTYEQKAIGDDCMYIVVSPKKGYGELETHFCNSKLKKYPQNVYPNDGLSGCVVFKRLSKSAHAELAERGEAKRGELEALRESAEKKLTKAELSAIIQKWTNI